MIQPWTKNALQRRVYLGQEATDTIAGLRCLSSKIVIEAAEHGQLGDLLFGQLRYPTRMPSEQATRRWWLAGQQPAVSGQISAT
jgi:hypothetical protein